MVLIGEVFYSMRPKWDNNIGQFTPNIWYMLTRLRSLIQSTVGKYGLELIPVADHHLRSAEWQSQSAFTLKTRKYMNNRKVKDGLPPWYIFVIFLFSIII